MNQLSLPAVSIPASDHIRLTQVALQAREEEHPVAEILLTELARAGVCLEEQLPDDTVMLDRWVTYRIDLGWPPESRILVCPEHYRDGAVHLSVLAPLGAALLGLRAGDRIPYVTIEGVPHVASVESVAPPPGILPFAPRRRADSRDRSGDAFDPGPSAA